jgi:imidazolonepropionase-like amidohydrolase
MQNQKVHRAACCFIGLLTLHLGACGSAQVGQASNVQLVSAGQLWPSNTEPVTVIEHVNVVTMANPGEVLRDATVVITAGRIEAINGAVPKNARIIAGAGKWLMPGLTDMHVHVPTDTLMRPKQYATEPPNLFLDTQDLLLPYIANGVTQIVNLDAHAESFAQRNEVEKGAVLGPHIALAALINGGNARGRAAATPADGRQAVRDAKAEGYDFIKLYSGLDVATFEAIVDECGKQDVKTVGHIPDAFVGNLDQALIPHFDMVAHAEEFSKHSDAFTADDIARFVSLAKRSGVWVTPTLTAMDWIARQSHSLAEIKASSTLRYMHPLIQSKWIDANRYNKNATPAFTARLDAMVKFHVQLVAALNAAGVSIVAGTDAGTSGVVPGFSLHDELELLAGTGMTPEAVLRAATVLPAQWLGVSSDRGTIEIGKRADVILLEANPLVDVRATRQIAGVIVNGRWASRALLDAKMADLAARNTAQLDKFRWNAPSSK